VATETAPAPLPAQVDNPNNKAARRAQKQILRDEGKHSIDAVRRDEATTIAADMEMGYYQPTDAVQWTPRPFIVAEVLRRMGYGKWYIKDSKRPRWWPGLEVFRRVVAWKIAVRRMQSQVDFANRNAWAGPLVGLAVEEMGLRLASEPEKVSDRDLTDLITKISRMFVEGRPSAPPPAGSQVGGATARFIRTTEVFELVDDPREREKMVRDYEASLDEARAAIPARVTPTT
jgi:hypothetical protein